MSSSKKSKKKEKYNIHFIFQSNTSPIFSQKVSVPLKTQNGLKNILNMFFQNQDQSLPPPSVTNVFFKGFPYSSYIMSSDVVKTVKFPHTFYLVFGICLATVTPGCRRLWWSRSSWRGLLLPLVFTQER